jgi:hypothetical protein
MKKMFVFVLTAILLLGLCACGQDPTQPTATPTQPKREETQPTQPAECTHTYADATCTAPKTCTACGATEADALGHDYKEGKCARCGATDESYVGLMDAGWAINALNEEASQIESILIRFQEGGMAMLGAGIYDRVATGEAGSDKIIIDGVEYAYAGFGIGGPVSYELKGDTIVITVDGTLTLKRSSGNTLTVVAIDGYVLVDFLQVGDVLTAK